MFEYKENKLIKKAIIDMQESILKMQEMIISQAEQNLKFATIIDDMSQTIAKQRTELSQLKKRFERLKNYVVIKENEQK